MLVVFVGIIPLIMFLASMENPEGWLRRAAVVVSVFIFTIDFSLQIASVVYAFSGAGEAAAELWRGHCTNYVGSRILVEFEEGIKVIQNLGILELFVSVFGLLLDMLDVFWPGKENKTYMMGCS